jgi:hypothetical protein
MRKTIDNILMGLQYTAAGTYVIMGVIYDKTTGITIGLSMLIMTVLSHMEKRKAAAYREMLDRLPEGKVVAEEALKKACEFTQLNTYERGILETGFISGAEFIYKKLNTK